MEELLREKLNTFRPSVYAKESIYNRMVQKSQKKHKSQTKHWYTEMFLILRRASMTASVTFGVLIFGMTTSYAYLSPNVNSESSLYFLKRSVESVEYSLAFSGEAKVEKLVKFTYRREKEIDVLANKGIKDTYGIGQVKRNIAEANVLLETIADEEVKQELYVKVNGEEVDVSDFEQEIEEEFEVEMDDVVPIPVLYEEEYEEVEYEELVVPVIVPNPVSEEELVAPIIEVTEYEQEIIMDSCFDRCTNGDIQQCGGGATKTCGDFDDNGCYEWGACKALVLPDGYIFDDFEWDL